MRIWPLVVVIVVLLAAGAGFAAHVRQARRGQRPSPALLVILALLLTFGLVALGAAIGYAARGTGLGAIVGGCIAGGIIFIVGPLVRAWTSARIAERQSGDVKRSA